MSELDLLIEQRLNPEAPTEFGRKVESAQTPPIHVDGVPLDDFMQGPPTDFDTLLQQRIDNPQDKAPPFIPENDNIVSTPWTVSGKRELDVAGRTIITPIPTPGGETQYAEVKYPELDLPYDSDDAIMLDRMAQGVRFDRGAGASIRAKLQQTYATEEARTAVLQKWASELPEGVNAIFDPALGQFYMPEQITESDVKAGEAPENLGKYRYVAIDENQLSFKDLADMANPGDILATGLAVVGAGRFAPMIGVPLRSAKGFAAEAAGGAAAGLTGQVAGGYYEMLFTTISTDGEWVPSAEQFATVVANDAAMEVMASVFGELAGRAIGKGSEWVQRARARLTGKRAIHASEEEIELANHNAEAARRDMELIKEHTGKDYVMTAGEAYGSIELRALERTWEQAASPRARNESIKKEAQQRASTRRYIDERLGGKDPAERTASGITYQANNAFDNDMVIVSQISKGTDPEKFTINFHLDTFDGPRVGIQPGGRDGTLGSDVWQVTHLDDFPIEMRGTGLVDDLYTAAAKEARVNNASFASDYRITPEANKVWERQLDEGNPAFEGMVQNKSGWNMKDGYMVTADGNPMWVVPAPEPILPKLLGDAGKGEGKLVKNKAFGEYIRGIGFFRGGSKQLAQEVNDNLITRQDFLNALVEDYEKATRKSNGNWDQEGFEIWREEVSPALKRIFNESELAIMQRRGGVRKLADQNKETVANAKLALRKMMPAAADFKLKDPTAGNSYNSFYKQWKKLTDIQRKRAVFHLERVGLLKDVSESVRNEVAQMLQKRVSHATVSEASVTEVPRQMEKIIDLVTPLLKETKSEAELMGRGVPTRVEYAEGVRTIATMIQRKGLSNLKQVPPERNPAGLALTRVLFGPLSRAQRFFSAARRFQIRSISDHAVQSFTDPQFIKDLVAIKDYPLRDRRVGQFLIRSGLLDTYYDYDSTYDPNDPKFLDQMLTDLEGAAHIMNDLIDGEE